MRRLRQGCLGGEAALKAPATNSISCEEGFLLGLVKRIEMGHNVVNNLRKIKID